MKLLLKYRLHLCSKGLFSTKGAEAESFKHRVDEIFVKVDKVIESSLLCCILSSFLFRWDSAEAEAEAEADSDHGRSHINMFHS